MLAILNSLNAYNFLIFQPILMILVSKFMGHRALSDKAYLSLGLLSPLNWYQSVSSHVTETLLCDHEQNFIKNVLMQKISTYRTVL